MNQYQSIAPETAARLAHLDLSRLEGLAFCTRVFPGEQVYAVERESGTLIRLNQGGALSVCGEEAEEVRSHLLVLQGALPRTMRVQVYALPALPLESQPTSLCLST